MYIYSQLIVTLAVWLTALPIPLSAVQRYVPVLFLLLGNIYGEPVNRTSLSLPLNTFVQLMVGGGTPSAMQDNETSEPPSTTTWSPALVVRDGGSVEEGNPF